MDQWDSLFGHRKTERKHLPRPHPLSSPDLLPALMPEPWHLLASARDLIKAVEHGDRDLVLLDCRHVLTHPDEGPKMYAEGHIPGAFHAHVDKDLSGPVGPGTGRHPLPSREALQDHVETWGIKPKTQVVAYDDQGGAFAARAWWLFRHHGHERVAVLDGGLPAYLKAGGTLTTEAPKRPRSQYPLRKGRLSTVDPRQLERIVPVSDGSLLDARDPPRYRGETEPIDPVAGHIPGAVNVPFKWNLRSDGRFRDADELRALYESILGNRDPRETTVYCGSGVTAVHNILAMEIAGLKGAALYPGSWSQWVSDPSRPIARPSNQTASKTEQRP